MGDLMFFKNKDFSFFYEKYGKYGKKIIILPGWGNNRKTFNYLISNLCKKNTIYIFDYPGFGNSKILNKDLTIYDYANMINAFLESNKIKNPIVIGHSFGGRIAIILNSYYKVKFKKLILMSSAGIKPVKTKKQIKKEKIYKLLKKLNIIMPSKIKKIYLNILIKKFGSSDYQNIPTSLRKTFLNIVNEDLTKYLDKIDAKTLLIWGKEDLDTPICDARKMEEAIKNSKLVIIENTTHFFYLEKPQKTLSIISSFLNEKD